MSELKIPFSCPPKMEPFFTTDKIFNVAYGGRGGGKSKALVQVGIKDSFLGSGYLLLTRYTEKSIETSSKASVEYFIKNLGLSEFFTIRNSYIENKVSGSEFVFNGLSKKTMENIASMENVFFAFLDEGHTIEEEAWQRFYPSIRGKYNDGSFAKIFVSFNPHSEDDVFYKYFVKTKRDDALVVKINWDENPFFQDSPLYVQYQSDLKYMPKAYIKHIWEGGVKQYNDEVVIKPEKIGRFENMEGVKYDYLALSLDTAYSIKESADFSVIIMAGGIRKTNELHIFRIMRGRWEFNELIENLRFAVNWINQEKGRYPDRILIENKASGQSLIQELERLSTLYVTKIDPKGDKFQRVCEVLPFIEEGKVKIPLENSSLNSWINPFLLELEMFRADNKHEHDDQVDALTQLIKDFNKGGRSIDWGSIDWS